VLSRENAVAVDAAARRFAERVGLQRHFLGQFAVLWVVGMLTYMGFGFVSPQFSILITGRGFSLQQFGIIQGMATFLSITSQVSLGKLSDKLDRRKPILAGALLLLIPVTVLFPHAARLGSFVASWPSTNWPPACSTPLPPTGSPASACRSSWGACMATTGSLFR
jgi:MFS family permease